VSSLYFLIPTIVTVFISLLVVRAGAIALRMTGMALATAKFQALSAFTGTGFTTREAETVVSNPVRRTIVSWLMILGNVGIVTVIITATSSFVQSRGLQIPANVVILGLGIVAIVLLVRRTGLVRRWEGFVEAHLSRFAAFEEAPADALLHLAEGYGLVRIAVGEASLLAGRSIADSGLSRRHAIVLGIERTGRWLAAPAPETTLAVNDHLVVYGRLQELRSFRSRPKGRSRDTHIASK
jgi:hypothetical protein